MFLHLATYLDYPVLHSNLFVYSNTFCLFNFVLMHENELSHFSEQYSFAYPYFNLFHNINLDCHILISLVTPWLLSNYRTVRLFLKLTMNYY